MPTRTLGSLFLLLSGLMLLTAAGCSRQYHVDDADKQIYGILREAAKLELGAEPSFSIDDGPSRNIDLTVDEILGDLPRADPQPEWLSGIGLSRAAKALEDYDLAGAIRLALQYVADVSRARADPLHEIDLATALRLARRNSRQFQSRKETLYQTALTLTSQLHVFEWQFGFSGSVMRTVEGADRDRSLGTDASFSLTRELVTGATIALDIGLTGLKYLNHELGTTLQSALSLSVSQALWRGADRTVVMNDLIQSRRNVIYALRSFARYEKEFGVSVASSYYNVLLRLERVKNGWEDYRNRTAARKRNELLAKAGRLRILELDQARQSEFQAQNSYLTALQSYERELDSFRMLIGLPTDAPVVLSRKELDSLTTSAVRPTEVDQDAAIQVALSRRLDLKNTRGAVEDADREVYVAADALKGDINFVGGIGVASQPSTRAGRFMFHEGLYEFGLELDLPLDRLTQRNNFRSSLIDYEAAVRDYMEHVDEIRQGIRESLRQLKRTEQTYRISEDSVRLAERRVAGTMLEQDAGRASTRDLLDSQDDLLDAQNALVEALVSHLTARLEFQRDMELIEVDDEGQIHEGDINLIRNVTGQDGTD